MRDRATWHPGQGSGVKNNIGDCSNSDPHWFWWGSGSSILVVGSGIQLWLQYLVFPIRIVRVQAGQNCPPNKEKNYGMSCLKNLNVLWRGLRGNTVPIWRSKKLPNLKIFKTFVIQILVWIRIQIRIQQQPRSGFWKLYGSGFSESESETMTVIRYNGTSEKLHIHRESG